MVDDSFPNKEALRLMLFGFIQLYRSENNLICLLTPFLISLWFTAKVMFYKLNK